MTLHQLRIFCAVVQAATMTRAGKRLGLAQPTLSQQLAKLEESVGTRLFERAGVNSIIRVLSPETMAALGGIFEGIEYDIHEVALSMVRSGLGVCLVPALAAHDRDGGPSGIELYASDQPDRQTVAVVPSHYARIDPYRSFL